MSLLLDALKSKLHDRPFNLEYAVTGNCNSRCQMCNQWKEPSENELSLDEISRIFNSYDGFSVVGLTGGEPTLRKNLSRIALCIAESQKRLKRLFITSNSFLPWKLKEDLKKILIGLEDPSVLTVLLSLDGDREMHDQIRGIPFAYDLLLNGLVSVLKLKEDYDFHVGISATYGPYNYQDYDRLLKQLEKLNNQYELENVVCVTWKGSLYKLEDWDFSYMKDLPRWVNKIKKVVNRTGSWLEKGRNLFYDMAFPFLENMQRPVVPCEAASIRYYMNAQGDLFPCVVWDEKIGSLRECNYDLKQVWENAYRYFPINIQRKDVRFKIEHQQCPVCYLTCETIPSMMAHPLHVVWRLL